MGVPIYTRFVLAATKGASGRLDEGAEPGVRGEEGWIGDRRGEKEKERAVGLRCMGTHVCARVASYARDEQREREATMRYRWRRVGGECQDSGGGGLEFPLLYGVDFAFERVAGSTTSLRPTTVCRLSGVDLPGGCEYDLFRGSRRFIGA